MSNFTIVSFIAILLVLNCSLNSLADDEQLGDGFGNFQDTDINNDGVVNENENNDVFWLNPSDYSITNGTGNFTDDFTNSNESIEQGTTVPTTPFYGDESTVQVPTVSSTPVLNDSVSTTQAPASITTIASTTSVPITTTTTSSSSSSSSVEDDRVNNTMSTTIMPISVIPTKLSNALYPSRLFSPNLTTSGTHSSTVSTKTYAIQTDYPSSTTVLPTTNQDSIAKSNSSASIPVVPVLSPIHVLSESRINPVNISVTTANTNATKLNNTNSTDSKISTNSLMNRNITIETDPGNSSHSIVSTLAFLLISFILSSLFM